ncbi:hypothetical protein [Micromonospora sp. NPDC002575]|uniref:hypothetical protein n=1 Tax=Micromonospora sp. NPDC002575 TaxID=3364222 RepID=UPI0036A351A5
MLTYYVIYRDEDEGDPAGIFIVDPLKGRALVWNHRLEGWSYDPGLAFRFLEDYRNVDRYREVDESRARQVALAVTGAEMPGESEVATIFQGHKSSE